MIEVPIWVIVLVCIAVAILLYISFIQYQRAEKSLQAANMLASNMSTIYSFIQQATEKMENPQLKQAFEADDEIWTHNLLRAKQLFSPIRTTAP